MARNTEPLDARTWRFPNKTLAFLRQLKANNNKEWFTEHRSVYEQAIKLPADSFCAIMTEELSKLTGQSHKAKVFRIYRDVRFSKDKTPYNTHLHISFVPEHSAGVPTAWFFGLSPAGLALGAGVFAFEKPELEVYRNRVAGPAGSKLASLLARLDKKGVRIGDPELKRVPAGFDANHPSGELLRRKGLSVWTDRKAPGFASKTGMARTCAADFKRLKPVFDWLQAP